LSAGMTINRTEKKKIKKIPPPPKKKTFMPENFPSGQFLRKADKCFDVCIVN
jgi:hypothetical protein